MHVHTCASFFSISRTTGWIALNLGCVARGPPAMRFTRDGGYPHCTHLSTSIHSRPFIAQKASYWLYSVVMSWYTGVSSFASLAQSFQPRRISRIWRFLPSGTCTLHLSAPATVIARAHQWCKRLPSFSPLWPNRIKVRITCTCPARPVCPKVTFLYSVVIPLSWCTDIPSLGSLA